jgi:signal peptidase I
MSSILEPMVVSSALRKVASELIVWVRTLTSAAVYATLIVTFGFQVARVEGRSMEPTLHDHDRLVVNKLAYQLHDPAVGDVVMLRHPSNPSLTLVKRVIASAGDTIAFRGGIVLRNGVAVDEAFLSPALRSFEDRDPVVVPEGYYFVLGDHRNDSSDSRVFGVVPKKYILGRVQVRWWPIPNAKTFEP